MHFWDLGRQSLHRANGIRSGLKWITWSNLWITHIHWAYSVSGFFGATRTISLFLRQCDLIIQSLFRKRVAKHTILYEWINIHILIEMCCAHPIRNSKGCLDILKKLLLFQRQVHMSHSILKSSTTPALRLTPSSRHCYTTGSQVVSSPQTQKPQKYASQSWVHIK